MTRHRRRGGCRGTPAAVVLLAVLSACSPTEPAPEITREATQAALNEEAVEPYVILADKFSADDEARRQLTELARGLYVIEDVEIRSFYRTPQGVWRGELTAHIGCAIPTDSPLLDRRDALTLAMAYRAVCSPIKEHPVRQIERAFTLEHRGGIWVAELDRDPATIH